LYAVAGQTQRRVVCKEEELPPGARRAVDVDGRSICVMNVRGRLYAVRNICPHQGASLCRGTIGSTMLPSKPLEYVVGLEDLVLRCPWHGWEFRIACLKASRAVSHTKARSARSCNSSSEA
jgi:3-phenylpropionate/trans-cinnamate dioxygenase ferredoxin subunit